MAVTKKQVQYTLIGAGVLIAGVIAYKLLTRKQAIQATAIKNQQLTQAAGGTIRIAGGAGNTGSATPPLLAPLVPIGLANTDANDPNQLTPISAASAPMTSTWTI